MLLLFHFFYFFLRHFSFFNFPNFLFLLLLFLLMRLFINYFSSIYVLRFVKRRLFNNMRCNLMFAIHLSIERTRIAFAKNFIIDDVHVKLRKFTFWAEDIFFNKPIKSFKQLLVRETSLNNIRSVHFSSFIRFIFRRLFDRL